MGCILEIGRLIVHRSRQVVLRTLSTLLLDHFRVFTGLFTFSATDTRARDSYNVPGGTVNLKTSTDIIIKFTGKQAELLNPVFCGKYVILYVLECRI